MRQRNTSLKSPCRGAFLACILLFCSCESPLHTPARQELAIEDAIQIQPEQQQMLKAYLKALDAEKVLLRMQMDRNLRLEIVNTPVLTAQRDSLCTQQITKLARVLYAAISSQDRPEALELLWKEDSIWREYYFFQATASEGPEHINIRKVFPKK